MSEERAPWVLIVDRRLGTLLSLDGLLSRNGYRVTTSSSSAEALEEVASRKPDLVISGRSGPEPSVDLVSRIKALSPETSVLLFVESDDDSMIAAAIAAGADGLLRRSYSDRQILRRVEQLLPVAQT